MNMEVLNMDGNRLESEIVKLDKEYMNRVKFGMSSYNDNVIYILGGK